MYIKLKIRLLFNDIFSKYQTNTEKLLIIENNDVA